MKKWEKWMLRVVYVGLIVFVVFLLSAAAYHGIKGLRYVATSPEEIYESVAEFYSTLYDRSDIKDGRFELWPKGGEKVIMDVTVESFEIEEKIQKELSNFDSVLEIETDLVFSATFSPKTVNVNLSLRGKDLEVPVIFSLMVDQEIIEETAEQLKQLLEPGKKVEIRGKIRRIPIYSTSSINEYALELYGTELRWGDDYCRVHNKFCYSEDPKRRVVILNETMEEKLKKAAKKALDFYIGHGPGIELYQIEGIPIK